MTRSQIQEPLFQSKLQQAPGWPRVAVKVQVWGMRRCISDKLWMMLLQGTHLENHLPLGNTPEGQDA